MVTVLAFVLGFLVTAFFVGIYFTIILYVSGDPVEDIADYGADWPRVDPAFHKPPLTALGDHDHA